MHERDRRDPAHCLFERLARLGHGHSTRLQAQECRDGLQVVLHAVMNLANRRVLGDEFAFTPANLGHVAAQQHRAHAPSVLGERQCPHRQAYAGRFDLAAPRRPPGHDDGQRFVDRGALFDEVCGHLDEGLPHERSEDSEAVEATQRIRARVEDLSFGVEANKAIPDARGTPSRARRCVRTREFTAPDHPHEAVRGFDVVELKPAGGAA